MRVGVMVAGALVAACNTAPAVSSPSPSPSTLPSPVPSAAGSEPTTAAAGAADSGAVEDAASDATADAEPPRDPAVRAAIESRFASDAEAQRLSLDLYDSMGTTCDVLPGQRFDGGYRGTITLASALPTGGDRKHLAWVSAALHDFDGFFAGLASHAPAPAPYRWHRLEFRFFRSIGNTTPNAFALDWVVSYNLNGSILHTADQTRELLFHEIFHLNDAQHGDWSPAHLTATQDAIERRCGARTSCLKPYAPTETIVRNGTYYAFQPSNDVHEYAAESALRYYREQRAMLRGERPVSPAFKCGPEENRKTWEALAAEFFSGVDLVPSCK